MDPRNQRDRVQARLATLKSARTSYDSHYKDIAEYIMPRAPRFYASDADGTKRHQSIIDGTATTSFNRLTAGLLGSTASPWRPWFKTKTPDPELNRVAAVRIWLDDLEAMILRVCAKSNTYKAFADYYKALPLFGTAAGVVATDFETVINHNTSPVGEYYIAADARGQVDTIYRQLTRTVWQVVSEFGLDKVSRAVKNMYDQGNLDAAVPLIHAIEPRESIPHGKRGRLAMPWASYYFEEHGGIKDTLRESGFQEFDVVAPRWESTSGEAYGSTCPGMDVLGDVKQLQHQQRRKALAIDHKTSPALVLPISMKNREADFLPDGLSYAQPNEKVSTAFEVSLDLSHLAQDMAEVRQRIRESLFVDLFLSFSQVEAGRMTATEAAQRAQEQLVMLGPTTIRLNNECLGPTIEIIARRLIRAGIVAPPPPELQGQELEIEFVSIMAQAQRAVGANSSDRFVQSLGVIASIKPEVLDKFDSDAWVDSYSDMLGVDPRMIVAGENVALIRQSRAAAEAQAQEAALMAQQAQTVKALGQTPAGGDTALTAMAQAVQG